MRMLWPSNSPDLNAIEACWPWMKRQTTKHGVPFGIAQMKEDWQKCWKKLPQGKIQEWIERIPAHIQRIIECGGGNEYKEGLGRNTERRKRTRNPARVR